MLMLLQGHQVTAGGLSLALTCQPLFIITTLIVHHSFTLSLQANNLPFEQILPTLSLLLPTGLPHDNGTGPDQTYHAHHFIFSFTFQFFCLFRVVD